MFKNLGIFTILVIISCLMFSSLSIASTFEYYDRNVASDWSDTISNNGNNDAVPSNWYMLGFPKNTTDGGFYSNGVFEFDSYTQAEVDFFNIIMYGKNNYSEGRAINIWIDSDSNHSSGAIQIAAYTFANSSADFKIKMDLKFDELYFSIGSGSYSDVGELIGTSLALMNYFNGLDSFYVGYACHFDLKKTIVEIGITPNQVPEPGTLILLGTGLGALSLAASRRRKK